MNTEQLKTAIENQTKLVRDSEAELGALIIERDRLRAELANLRWGVRVNSTVVLPDGSRYMVYKIQMDDRIEFGNKPWIYGQRIRKDGEPSDTKPRCLFDDWTVEGV